MVKMHLADLQGDIIYLDITSMYMKVREDLYAGKIGRISETEICIALFEEEMK